MDEDNVIVPDGMQIIKITLYGDGYKNITNNKEVLGALYKTIKNTKFKEYVGIYQPNEEGVSSANKLTYRVITFVETTEK